MSWPSLISLSRSICLYTLFSILSFRHIFLRFPLLLYSNGVQLIMFLIISHNPVPFTFLCFFSFFFRLSSLIKSFPLLFIIILSIMYMIIGRISFLLLLHFNFCFFPKLLICFMLDFLLLSFFETFYFLCFQ